MPDFPSHSAGTHQGTVSAPTHTDLSPLELRDAILVALFGWRKEPCTHGSFEGYSLTAPGYEEGILYHATGYLKPTFHPTPPGLDWAFAERVSEWLQADNLVHFMHCSRQPTAGCWVVSLDSTQLGGHVQLEAEGATLPEALCRVALKVVAARAGGVQ